MIYNIGYLFGNDIIVIYTTTNYSIAIAEYQALIDYAMSVRVLVHYFVLLEDNEIIEVYNIDPIIVDIIDQLIEQLF
ncbi:hypothetical protein TetV_058 [Tetraselmis virus 1]|uniref:Uncharacterized protein n=1 Tax=Tetraselmis virus 1 TaxID=2060617 RepID=A0A2P0VMP6_9VIRU|nr:hypothetical protein QJ968_gp058 [Tetraselmis virus 1]AUF82150.1 hypothetical protein TetV_058 [Tetraselmis virus 1]